jgi:Flp pilus assembly protein TadD
VHQREAEAWRDLAFSLSGAALRQDADDPHALRVRGRILTFKGERAAARRALEKASSLLPDLPGPTAELAYAYAEDGDFETADRLLTRVLELDPYDEDVATARARVLVELGRRGDAVRVLEDVRAKLGPTTTRAQLAVDIALGGGDLDAALRHVFDVLMFWPRAPDVHTKAGDILLAQGDRERARLHLTEALRLDPSFAPARELLGRLDGR